MNNCAVCAPRSPRVYEMINLVSASMAVHVQTLPAPAFTCSRVRFLSLPYTNAQISSHWIRRTLRLRTYVSWYDAAAHPKSFSSFKTVCLATPVMRHVALIETPSTRAAITWPRFVWLRQFIVSRCIRLFVYKVKNRTLESIRKFGYYPQVEALPVRFACWKVGDCRLA